MEKPKILVIDDEGVIRELLSRTLSAKGYVVETSVDGQDALEKTKNKFFNILITDLKMPRLNGLELLKQIKQGNPYMEVIIITGYPTIEDAVAAIKIGAYDFICKPFDVEDVYGKIEHCLEKQRFNMMHVQLGELKSFFELSKVITSTFSLDSLMSKIIDATLEITKARRSSIVLFDDREKEGLIVRMMTGKEKKITYLSPEEFKKTLDYQVARAGQPWLIEDVEQDPRVKRKNKAQYKTKSFLIVPLMTNPLNSKGRTLGVINVTDKLADDPFTEREKALVSVLAGQAAVALENSKLYEQLQSKIDALKKSLSELDATKNQLIQTEKLAAVGQLAFGIAHEIRNPLGIILGGIDFLNVSLDGRKDLVESIEKIKHSVKRANEIILELLKFSRASQLQLQVMHVSQIMDEVISLIQNKAYLNQVKVSKTYKDDNFRVRADPNMLRQALFNLCLNAIDAMAGGGTLTLNIYAVENKQKKANDVVIEVADTGPGISPDVQLKIFEPFFTTKDPGKGTGLGLSIVHLILERHDAAIEVQSRLNEGAKFLVKLQAVPETEKTE